MPKFKIKADFYLVLFKTPKVEEEILSQVIGLLASCHALLPLGMIRLHTFFILVRDHFDMRVDRPSKLIPLSSPVILSTLEFWSPRKLVPYRLQ